jgi:hypothetical protein
LIFSGKKSRVRAFGRRRGVRTGFCDEFEREIRGDVHIAKFRHECAVRAAGLHDGIEVRGDRLALKLRTE